jgi:hypothetical protein
MRIVKKITDQKFINLYKVVDKENNVNGYLFAERLGVDSVAFLCYDKKTKKFLLNKESTPPIGKFMHRAFGGSIDKSVNNYKEIVKGEAKEEGGFTVNIENIHFLNKMFVSTQMNQFCYLYLVEVDKEDQKERQPENALEAMAEPKWVDEKFILENTDWKSISILTLSKSKGLL